jgi:hypothetical protein
LAPPLGSCHRKERKHCERLSKWKSVVFSDYASWPAVLLLEARHSSAQKHLVANSTYLALLLALGLIDVLLVLVLGHVVVDVLK